MERSLACPILSLERKNECKLETKLQKEMRVNVPMKSLYAYFQYETIILLKKYNPIEVISPIIVMGSTVNIFTVFNPCHKNSEIS